MQSLLDNYYMAKKKAKNKITKPIEETLWESANKLRGAVEPSEYKHVVLSLIFLKYANDKFEARRLELIENGKEAFVNQVVFYTARNVFYIPESARWAKLMTEAKQADLALHIDAALAALEQENESLRGALPSNYYASLALERTKLATLLDRINEIDTLSAADGDLMGRVYEYFLSKFAIAEGKGKGEFYTPKTIVQLMTELIEPYSGKIYDPCCGSGGMFVQSLKFIEAHQGNRRAVSVYGQEYTNTTYKLAKMNLAIRGIACNLGEQAADTFFRDQHPDLKADFILANPPFNQKAWRGANELTEDPRWRGFPTPPTSNANYGWILNILSKLSHSGTAAFLLANGALSGDGVEQEIRKELVERGVVEAIILLPRNMFYSTDISVTLWILARNRSACSVEQNGQMIHYRERKEETLFIDLRQEGEPFEKKYVQFNPEQIVRIAQTYHSWQREGYEKNYSNVPEYCYSATRAELAAKDYSLVPSKYIAFANRDEAVDFASEMQSIQQELQTLLVEEAHNAEQFRSLFDELGFPLNTSADV